MSSLYFSGQGVLFVTVNNLCCHKISRSLLVYPRPWLKVSCESRLCDLCGYKCWQWWAVGTAQLQEAPASCAGSWKAWSERAVAEWERERKPEKENRKKAQSSSTSLVLGHGCRVCYVFSTQRSSHLFGGVTLSPPTASVFLCSPPFPPPVTDIDLSFGIFSISPGLSWLSSYWLVLFPIQPNPLGKTKKLFPHNKMCLQLVSELTRNESSLRSEDSSV